LLEEKALGVALLNVTASVTVGILAVYLGERAGRML
jgi:fluoride ion exporter CrcB/FEX